MRLLLVLALASSTARPDRRAADFHLRLERSVPAAGDTVVAPREVRLWFTEEPQLAITRLRLLNEKGEMMPLAKPEMASEKGAPVVATVGGDLAPGRYTLTWKTAATDGHVQSGEIRFVVRAAAGKRGG